jgi:hypothetical protein
MRALLTAWAARLEEAIQFRPRRNIDAVAVAARRAGWKQKDVFAQLFMATVTLGVLLAYIVSSLFGVFLPPEAQVVDDFRLDTDYRDANAPFTSLALGQDGTLLLGSDGRGLHVYDTASRALGSWEQVTQENTAGGLLSNRVLSLAASDQGFWIAAGGGLSWANSRLNQWNSVIDTSSFKYLDVQRDINTVRMTPDATTLFIGTKHDGVGIYDTRQHRWVTLSTENERLFSDTIHTLEIGLGSVWVGTDKGLNVFELESLFTQAGPVRQDNLQLRNLSILQITVQDQDTWIRTESGGVKILHTDPQIGPLPWRTLIGENGFPAAGQDSTEITAVAQIGKRLFVGTKENGIGVYDIDTHDWKVYSASSGLWSSAIRMMAVWSGKLWVATSAGINSFDTDMDAWEKVAAAAGEDIVNMKADADDIWYVTANGEVGVYHVLEESWEAIIGSGRYGTAHSSTAIRSLAVYQGLIWVASADQGVGSYDTQKHSWQLRNAGFPASNGLLDQEVIELQLINGGLWSRTVTDRREIPNFTVYQWQDTQWLQVSQEGQNVRAMVGDGSRVWFLLSDGSLVDQSTGQSYFDSPIDRSLSFNAAVNVGGNELYLSSPQDGIWHYDLHNHNWQRLTLTTESGIDDVATDGESIWYATRYGGVGNFQLSSSQDRSVFPEALAEIDISSLAVTTMDAFQGSFWFADENGRVYEYNPISHMVQEHSGNLDFIQRAEDIRNLQIRAGNGFLWYLVTTRSEQQDNGVLYRYEASTNNWVRVGNAAQNVVDLEVQDDQVWYRTAAGAIVNVTETGELQSYFSGTFEGLENIGDVEIDGFGRIWFVSGRHGAAYYFPSTHNWRAVPVSVSATLKTITIVPGQSPSMQDAYITAATGLFHATVTRSQISDWKSELAGYEILNLTTDGSTIYALAQRAGRGIWLFQKQETEWVPVIQDPWMGTNISLHAELVYQDKLWGVGSDGSLWVYDPERHELLRAADDSSKLTSLAVMDDRLWAFSISSNDSRTTDVYGISGESADYRLSHHYTASVPPEQLVIYAGRLWQTNDQGLATISTENGAPQPILGDPAPVIRQTAVRELVLRVPQEWVWYLAISVLVIIEVMAGLSWWDTRRSRLVLMISAAILLVGLSIVYSYFYGLVLDRSHSHRQIAATSLATSIVSFDDKVWIGTNQGVWRFSYNSSSNLVVDEQYDPLGSIEELQVAENALYARLQDGSAKKYDGGWQEVNEIPHSQKSSVSGHWKVVHRGDKPEIQLRESENTYSTITFENGGFKHDQIRNLIIQDGDLWMATAGGVARYRPKEDGSGLSLIQIYGNSDGLPETAVQACVVAAASVVCRLDDHKLMRFENGRWQPYSGNDPFDATHTVFQFPSKDFAFQSNTEGDISGPANIADAEAEQFSFDHIEDLTFDAQGDLWVKTGSGAWRWHTSDIASVPSWEYSPLTTDIRQRFEIGQTRGNRQTWAIEDGRWQWQRTVDPVTGREQVQIAFGLDRSIARQFTRSRRFADQFIHAVWAEHPVAGKTTIWLGTHSGIWKASYAPAENENPTLQLQTYYAVGGNQVVDFRVENGKLYAQVAAAERAFLYDAVKNDWTPSSFNPFLKSQVVLDAPSLGLIVQETANGVQINPTFDDAQGRFPFDVIQGIAAQPGSLWVATRDGVLEYKYKDTSLELQQHYSAADGLQSANITDIKTDQKGNLFSSVEEGKAYYRFSQDGKWLRVSSNLNPFQSPRIRIEKVPGLVTWYLEGQGVSMEFQGEPVTFQNGTFDFDNVTDIFPEKDLLWLLTGHGILRYQTASPITFEAHVPTWSMADPPQALARLNGETFVRVDSGAFLSWQQPDWQDQGACQDPACPFEYPYLQLQDTHWQMLSSSDGPSPQSHIRISGIPADQVFDSQGKFPFDFAQSLAVTASSAWLATRGGVVQFETQPELLIKHWSTLDDNLPTLNVSRVHADNDQVIAGFNEDSRLFSYDPAHDTEWKETGFTTDLFTVPVATFENGKWYPIVMPEKAGVSLLQTPGAPANFQLFDVGGKFTFDYVEKIRRDGSILLLQTRGGLVQSTYQGDHLAIQRFSFDAPAPSGSALPPVQLQLSPRNPVDLVLRLIPGAGVQLWRDDTLVASYSNTEKYLGLFGSEASIDSVIDVAQDNRHIYLVTESKLIVINTSSIERGRGPWSPNTPTPTLTLTPPLSPIPVASSTLAATRTPIPSATVLPPTPISSRTVEAVVRESSNVREGPGIDYPVMISYTAGTELRVIGISQNGDWLQVILLDGREGWINIRLVSLPIDDSLLPVVAEIPATPTR